MGLFGIPSPTHTMGRAGNARREKARREKFEETGHASPGPDVCREEPVSVPVRPRRRNRR